MTTDHISRLCWGQRALLLVAACGLLALHTTTASPRSAQSMGLQHHHPHSHENHTKAAKAPTVDNNASIVPQGRLRPEEALGLAADEPVEGRPDHRSLQQNEAGVVLRINCGSDQETYVDAENRVWSADQYFTHGQSGGGNDNGNDWQVFQTYRAERGAWLWGLIPNGRTLLYTLPVSPAGNYEVTLYFPSNKDTAPNSIWSWFMGWFGAATYFDINEGGSTVFSSEDMPSPEEANPQNGAVTMSLQTTVNSNNEIQLEFIPHGSDAYVSAIEVRSLDFSEAPSPAPTDAPVSPPSAAPTTSRNSQPTVSFELLINAGGDEVTDFLGRKWISDQYFSGGNTFSDASFDIKGSQDDYLYHTERFGQFNYEIPVPEGDFEVILHFAELWWESQGSRLFNVAVEGKPVFENVDIVQLAGSNLKAVTLETPQTISDGFVSISFTNSVPQKINNPKLSGIEIKFVEPHLAHAVANGPYTAIDSDGDDEETIPVDGSLSHTHGPGLVLVEYTWKTGSTILGTGVTTNLTLPVGDHTVTLTVLDSGGNQSTEATTITVLSGEYPSVSRLSPDNGPVAGGTEVTITGSGFTSLASETTVMFGQNAVTGSAIEIENDNTIQVTAPASSEAIPVDVSVKTGVGMSNKKQYTYVGTSKIEFEEKYLKRFEKPTVVRFGPNGKLYVGNTKGQIGVFTVDENLNMNEQVISTVSQWRPICGIAFDPLDTSSNPDVYFTNSYFYHGEENSSSGDAINGKISKASGANLDSVVDIIVGLPVSDHDHGINAIEFGDKGELYIQVGGNTNGGLPGQISGSQKLKENVLSGATLVAYLSNPGFDGVITYDKDDDGNQVGAKGSVDVFAPGMRNPYGIVLHSNGKLYGTDNGPNLDYGNMKKSCNGQQVGDIEEDDKVNLIVKNGYYGHPNPKRAESDSRQCVWRSFNDQSDGSFNAPLLKVPASTNGIVEFKSDAFDGQLRGNLIVSQYNSAIYRVILSNGGTATSTEHMNPTKLAGGSGLDVTQAPDGSLVEARLSGMAIYGYKPKEAGTSSVVVKSVWPYRGGQAGGSTLTVYGKNLKKGGANPIVTVGGSDCAVQSASNGNLQCTLPGGSGTVDVAVKVNGESYTFKSGYRYVTGN